MYLYQVSGGNACDPEVTLIPSRITGSSVAPNNFNAIDYNCCDDVSYLKNVDWNSILDSIKMPMDVSFENA